MIKTDVAKQYVDWAVEHDFAVIDANIPKHYTSTNVSDTQRWIVESCAHCDHRTMVITKQVQQKTMVTRTMRRRGRNVLRK